MRLHCNLTTQHLTATLPPVRKLGNTTRESIWEATDHINNNNNNNQQPHNIVVMENNALPFVSASARVRPGCEWVFA